MGGRYRMEEGEIEVDSIEQIELQGIAHRLAIESGFLGVIDLLKIAMHGPGENVSGPLSLRSSSFQKARAGRWQSRLDPRSHRWSLEKCNDKKRAENPVRNRAAQQFRCRQLASKVENDQRRYPQEFFQRGRNHHCPEALGVGSDHEKRKLPSTRYIGTIASSPNAPAIANMIRANLIFSLPFLSRCSLDSGVVLLFVSAPKTACVPPEE